MSREIILGLDIGTQFCFAGFYDMETGDFISLVEGSGIPTDVAYNDVNKKLYYGEEAENYRKSKNVDNYFFPKAGFSLKTKAREMGKYEGKKLYFYSKNNKYIEKYLKDILPDFIDYIASNVETKLKKLDTEYKIRKIHLAYPDVRKEEEDDNTREYRHELTKIVSEKFSKKFGDNIDIDINSEGRYAQDLLQRIYKAKYKESYSKYSNFFAIDVGAGTTDFSLMVWNPINREYDLKYLESCEFGGKIIDKILVDVYGIKENTSQNELIKYKKQLYNPSSSTAAFTIMKDGKSVSADDFDFNLNSVQQYSYYSQQFKTHIINAGRHIDSSYKIILMGGSSVIPFVKRTVIECLNLQEENVVFLEKEGESFGTTNSNFIAMAEASYLQKINTTLMVNGEKERYVLCTKPQGFSPDTYAVKLGDTEDNECFLIIAERGIDSDRVEQKYYMPIISTYQHKSNVSSETNNSSNLIYFNPSNNLYLLKLKKNLNGMKKIYKKDYDDYISKFEELHSNEFIGVKDEIKDSWEKNTNHTKNYFRATIFDYTASDDKQLSIYVYHDGDDHTCYYNAKEGQTEIKWEDFNEKIENQNKQEEVVASISNPPSTDFHAATLPQTTPTPIYSDINYVPASQKSPRNLVYMLWRIGYAGLIALGLLFSVIGLCLTYLGEKVNRTMWGMTIVGMIMLLIAFGMTLIEWKKHKSKFSEWFKEY